MEVTLTKCGEGEKEEKLPSPRENSLGLESLRLPIRAPVHPVASQYTWKKYAGFSAFPIKEG
jgi:hypothetical protein